jgi:hypothetical protein
MTSTLTQQTYTIFTETPDTKSRVQFAANVTGSDVEEYLTVARLAGLEPKVYSDTDGARIWC